MLAGIGYTVAWVASLSVGAPNPSVAATGRQVLAAYAGHGWQAMTMFVLAEGVAAVALAIVVLAAALVLSGLGYVLLAPGLATAVYPAGVLLLVFVTGTGVTVRG
ncbi:MAG TPA: hypothetical protein VHY31_05430 [Streptosporangiaceae bacterium]|nr:hypothetical protein [Streptosporangiaceae bacterium]